LKNFEQVCGGSLAAKKRMETSAFITPNSLTLPPSFFPHTENHFKNFGGVRNGKI